MSKAQTTGQAEIRETKQLWWRFISVSRENRCAAAAAHCNSSTWEAEAGGSLKFLGRQDLHSKLQARGQGYTIKPLIKKKKKKKKEKQKKKRTSYFLHSIYLFCERGNCDLKGEKKEGLNLC